MTASRSGRKLRASVFVTVGVILCAATASGAAQECGTAPGAQLFQLDRRSATHLLVNQTRPDYPPLARINYIRGHVRVLVTVNCRGKVQQAHVVLGHPFLAIAALRAIRRWVYHPFMTRTGPIPFQTVVDVDFSLLSPHIQRLPPQPEKFLERGVRPPEILTRPAMKGAKSVVHMRVLVNAQGHAADFTLLSGDAGQFETAKKIVSHWKIKPARWGNIDVPWYLEINVPLRNEAAEQAAAEAPAQP